MELDLSERARRTEEVVARWRKKPFDWRTSGTCIHLARAQMRALGHKPPTIPRFRSALGAARALKAAGFETIEELLDSMLPRVPPAAAWVGDLLLLDGDQGFDTVVIAAGGALLGYHEDYPREGIKPLVFTKPSAAWRL